MKEDYQIALKKLTLFFLSNPVPFNGQDYKKQNGHGTRDQSLFRLQNKLRKVPLLVIYYLSKFEKRFLSCSKISSATLCKPIHDIIDYSTFKCRKEGGKIEYLQNEKSFLDEIKGIFYSFWWDIISRKKIKIVDTSFKTNNMDQVRDIEKLNEFN